MVSDPRAKTSGPAHAVLAVVLQVRDGQLQVLLWERALEPFRGSWALPGGDARRGRDARAVDPPPPRGEGRRARALPPRAARDAQRPGPQPARAGSSRPPTSASSRATSTRRCPPTRAGTRSTSCRSSRSTTARSCSPAASGCARSSRTRTSASRSRPTTFTISELRDLYRAALGHDVSATNLQRVLLRRHLLVPTGSRREPGPAGGRPAALFGFRSRDARDHRPVRGAAPAGLGLACA